MGIISINEKRTAVNPTHTTGREKSYFTSDQFKEAPGLITTDLNVHYDFGDTDCWTGVVNSTSSTDYTINNLANNYNDALFRSRSGGVYSNGNDSPQYSYSSDGGGCVQFNPKSNTNDNHDCGIVIPGSSYNTSDDSVLNDLSSYSLGASDSNNLLNGVGTGNYTFEVWFRIYSQSSSTYQAYGWNRPIHMYWVDTSGSSGQAAIFARERLSSPSNGLYIWGGNHSVAGAPTTNVGAWSDWNHVVISRTGTSANATKIYINNSLEESRTDSTNYASMQYLTFGVQFHVGQCTYRYGIFRFYKGKGLTAEEVETNWNAQKSRFGH